MFAILRTKFEVGTRNPVKQIIKGVLNRYRISHTCRRRCHVRMKNTMKSDDRLFYTWDATDGYAFFCAQSVGKDSIKAYRVESTDSLLGHAPWGRVGVFKYLGLTKDTVVIISKKDIAGKAVMVGDTLLSMSENVLVETY
jgi:uncharacterized ubiquitin-like protein YukD